MGHYKNLKSLKAIPRKLFTMGKYLCDSDPLILRWATEGVISQNWGDKLNLYLSEKMTGRSIYHRADLYPVKDWNVHYWIGSHLATACGDKNAVVWGAGFLSSNIPVVGRPKRIHAVRGWLSNARLKELGLDAPDVVGDVALLMPLVYKPKKKYKKVSLGIIPHCFEWDLPFYKGTHEWSDVRVIDICGDIEDVVEQITACDRIISSSLHGIICADAYGIPAIWLHASNKPLGDGFKFRDYFSSVGRPDDQPLVVTADSKRNMIESKFFDYGVDIDLKKLIKSSPVELISQLKIT